MSFSVSDGIGNGDARQVDALVALDRAADDDRANGASVVDTLDAQPHVAVVDEDIVARFEHLAHDCRRDRKVDLRALRGQRATCWPFATVTGAARFPMRSFGP